MLSRNLFIGLILGALIAGIVSLVIFRKQKELVNSMLLQQQEQIEQQSRLIESFRQSNNANLMSNVLNKADEDLRNNPNRSLSDETIGRIAALSYSFRSHVIAGEDSTSLYRPSPERGQLLLMLTKMNIDTASLKKIMKQTSFAGAVLRDANLEGANLRNIDLKNAELQSANLKDSNLEGANLEGANLWAAVLNNAKMGRVYMKGADLRWAEINGADLKKADLHEADLTSAKLRKADLQGANLQWTEFNHAFLNEANLDSADMFRTEMKRAQLTNAVMRGVNLNLANISEANLTGANLSGANLNDLYVNHANWLASLTDSNVMGATELQSKYKIIEVKTSGQKVFQIKEKGK